MGLRSYSQFGPRASEVGAGISSATPEITSPVHHVITTATLTTIVPPQAILRDILEIKLIADSVFSWTTSGNILGPVSTTLVVGKAYGFIYDKTTGKWYSQQLS